MPDFVPVCNVCDGTGRIILRTIPSDESIPCVCQDPYFVTPERLAAREGTMSEVLSCERSGSSRSSTSGPTPGRTR